MALIRANRVREITTTTGTGVITLGGVVSGFRTFSSGIGVGNTCFYVITFNTDWEIGVGTLTSATTLSRDTVIESSNASSLVNFPAGTKNIFVDELAHSFKTNVNGILPVSGGGTGGTTSDSALSALGGMNETRLFYDMNGGTSGLITANQLLMQNVSVRDIAFPANLSDSRAIAGTAPSASTSFSLTVNGVSKATITFAASSTVGTMVTAGNMPFTLSPSQVIKVIANSVADTTLANVSFTLLGNTTIGFGLFASGNTIDSGNGRTFITDKYCYSNDIVAPGTSLATPRDGIAAAGNSSRGIFGGGFSTAYTAITEKYTYSGDSFLAGTSLGTARYGLEATGNSSRGIFGGGYNGTTVVYVVDKYTYLGDTVSVGTNLTTIVTNGGAGAAGNSTFGIFGGGSGITNKYIYSTDVVSASTILPTYIDGNATGNSTVGIFLGGLLGGVSSTNRYTYSGDTVISGTNLNAYKIWCAATGNSNKGIFGGGGSLPDGLTALTDIYTYATDSVLSGTNLLVGRKLFSATSSTPGAF